MTTAVVQPVAIKIDSDIKARVKRLADARHRTPHWLMREAISQYVEREEKREAFRQDGLKAWQEYQETGLHAHDRQVIPGEKSQVDAIGKLHVGTSA